MTVRYFPSWLNLTKKYVFPVELGLGITATAAKGMPEQLDITGANLAAAAIFSGRPSHLLNNPYSMSNADYDQLRVTASLSLLEPIGPNLRRAREYHNEIDPTEKSYLNYSLGGTMTMAFLTDRVNIPWLGHYSMVKKQGISVLTHPVLGKSEPDYIGLNTAGTYFVAEAKGRERVNKGLKDFLNRKNLPSGLTATNASAPQKVRPKSVLPRYAQTAAVISINGLKPANRYGVAVETGGKMVRIYATDPVDEFELPLPQAWISSYYEYVRTVCDMEESPSPGIVPESWIPVTVELPEQVSKWVKTVLPTINANEIADSWSTLEEEVKAANPRRLIAPNLTILKAVDSMVPDAAVYEQL